MTAPATTGGAMLPPLVRDAARGELPAWAVVSPPRRAHIERVAALLGEWAERLAQPPHEVARWRAAGWLHDCLRDADPAALRAEVPPAFRDLHPNLLHGPATAERLRGVADGELRDAIRYHTLGYAGFGLLGRALYLADFMEPGRRFAPEWTAALRARMPDGMDEVLREVVAARAAHVAEDGAVHPLTLDFLRAVTGEPA